MALYLELLRIKHSTVDEINDSIRQTVGESLIGEYPSLGAHQFYTESFEYKGYGYNVAINMLFNIKQPGEVCCCKKTLFFGVKPCRDPVTCMGVIKYKTHSKTLSFLSFSVQLKDMDANDAINETHRTAEGQINSLLQLQKANVKILK
jgi:hypothetical protein